jgi:uncharacterized membrane protein
MCSTTTTTRAVLDRIRDAVEAAGMDVRLVDDLPAPLMVSDLYELALVVGCLASTFLGL